MVHPGEVDDDFINEVKEECINYGYVNNVKIYEYPQYNFPIAEKIRVYVEFERVDSAIIAFERLYDRYFSGRIIKLRFYNEELYNNNILDSFNF